MSEEDFSSSEGRNVLRETDNKFHESGVPVCLYADSSIIKTGQEKVTLISKPCVSKLSYQVNTTSHRHNLSSNTQYETVGFTRKELNDILSLYGFMVAAGEWRDYALDFLTDKAVFSIFRRTREWPIYRIEKHPKLAKRQGAYMILTPHGQILKRGHELKNVLSYFKPRPKLV